MGMAEPSLNPSRLRPVRERGPSEPARESQPQETFPSQGRNQDLIPGSTSGGPSEKDVMRTAAVPQGGCGGHPSALRCVHASQLPFEVRIPIYFYFLFTYFPKKI